MSYDAGKTSKLLDMLEETATEWMNNHVTDYYEVDEIEQLTEEQITEVQQYRENDCDDDFVALALGNLINLWEMENDSEGLITSEL